MKRNFAKALDLVFQSEGGFVFDRYDPGGATKYGITQATLSRWRGKSVSTNDVKTLKRHQAAEIYRARYWDSVNGDNLPDGLDYALFDFAVNSGPRRAAKFIQKLVGVRRDGIIGGMTLAAIRTHRAQDLIEKLQAKRGRWLQSLRGWWRFGRGWTSRVRSVEEKAVRMANSANFYPRNNDGGVYA